MTHTTTPPTLGSLVARDVVKSYAARTVLPGVDVVASPGRVLALVGENGSGKSTLLRVLAGVEEPDGGTVQRPADVGHLPQDPAFAPASTVGHVLDSALEPLHTAVERLEELAGRLEDPDAAASYGELLDWAVAHDAWDATRRATEVAARLGLAGLAHDRRVSTLSGGERSRLALAAMLTRRPTCLLLDEPTNHLDDGALEFLEQTLRSMTGVVVVASHDRVFLDNVADAVLDLDATHFGSDGAGGRVRGVTAGGYSELLAAKAADRRRWETAFEEQQDEMERLRQAAATTARRVAHNRPPRDGDKFIYHAKGEKVARTISRRVADAERRLQSLEDDRIAKPPQPLSFDGVLAPDGAGSIRVRDLVVPGRLVLDRLDVDTGGRLLVCGRNGSGKSTLLKLVAGRLSPSSLDRVRGEVSVQARRIGYLAQDVQLARPGASAAAVYARAVGDGAPPLRSLGLVHPKDVHRPVGELSVGQQRRLALAVLVAGRPDLVLLDEPTNHLSLALAEELEDALDRSVGTVVVASHDRWLRRRWVGDVLPL